MKKGKKTGKINNHQFDCLIKPNDPPTQLMNIKGGTVHTPGRTRILVPRRRIFLGRYIHSPPESSRQEEKSGYNKSEQGEKCSKQKIKLSLVHHVAYSIDRQQKLIPKETTSNIDERVIEWGEITK